jgi:hypothetical protein
MREFNAGDVADILKGVSAGAASINESANRYATSKAEAKELKRRTLAKLLASASKREQGLYRAGQDYSGEMSDTKSQAMHDTARGLVDTMSGSTEAVRNLYRNRSKKAF